jgi:glutamate synthase domain-containing protein 2
MSWWQIVILTVAVLALLVAMHDLSQKRHALLRNFPIVGHFRYLLERVGPELRQYIVTGNNEELPFSRDHRRWVYASAKGENAYFGFGTDNRMDESGYPFFHHSAFPIDGDADEPIPSLKVLGEWRDRADAFRPASIINISAMSFGSLSSAAIQALNRGAGLAGCMHNTGEGGISTHHRHGGDLVFQIGTGYFGARDGDGRFSIDTMLASMEGTPTRAIEVKLSQGAKPGLGGLLPGSKVTKEIANARGVPVGVTVRSPARHQEFGDIAGLVDFVERIADAAGVPVGIKSAVGDPHFWSELADEMQRRDMGPDFITVDGGEGGTGAAPLLFADHVALPFHDAFGVAYRAFDTASIAEQVTFIGSGKLGFPAPAALALAAGADMINVGREAMLAVGCIQAQKCHTGHCPTGVATQNARLVRGLDPTDKSVRTAGYVGALRHDLRALAYAMGHDHPAKITPDQITIR